MRKYILFIFIAISCVVVANAREYDAFFSVGKRWTVCRQYGWNDGRPAYFYTYTVLSSESEEEKDIYSIGYIDENNNHIILGYGYEENDRVYVKSKSDEDFQIIFDFNVKVGDKLQIIPEYDDPYIDFGDFYYNVLSVEYEEIMLKNRKVIKLLEAGANTNHWFRWIEGIGCIHPRFETLIEVQIPSDYSFVHLESCYEGDECIFSFEDYFGHSNVEDIEYPKENSTPIIYDLHGRQIKNPQPGSIYIRNGKKTVF